MNECLHCKTPLAFDQIDYCCVGCEKAYEIIHENGFKNYYASRIINPNESLLRPQSIDDKDSLADNLSLAEFIIERPNNYEVNLIIQGLHCGACVWLIENLLKKQECVINARINLTQKTLKLEWAGDKKFGDDLVKLITAIGYKVVPLDNELIAKNQHHAENQIFKALAVAGFGAGNIMLFSFALWFNDALTISGHTRQFLHLLSLIIALPVLIYSGRIFFASAFKSIKMGFPNMDIAISMAIILASIVSIIQTFRGQENVYFDSVVMLVFFLLIGRYLDFKVRKKAFNIATEFAYLQASFGRVEIFDKIVILPAKKLQQDMVLIVAVGEKIACDGVVIEGESAVNNSLISGESLPEKITKNSLVYGGAINLEKPIKVKITKPAHSGILAEIISIINNIESKKNFYIRLADRFSKYYTPAIHLLALLTFGGWFWILNSRWDIAMMNATAVLIITCPCALALAIPVVQAIAVSVFLKKGIIIKNGQALEIINNINCVVFDKTGSLTYGTPRFQNIYHIENDQLSIVDDDSKNTILLIAQELAKYSTHPLSRAIQNIEIFHNDSPASRSNMRINNVEEVQAYGLKALLDGEIILRLGNADWCDINHPQITQNIDEVIKREAINLRCFLAINNQKYLITFKDEVKQDAPQLINYLKNLGKKVILLSGDGEYEVSRVAQICGIDEYYWCKNPVEKTQILQQIRQDNVKLMMIGDGLNDAPSLALADVSVSFAQAVDISQNIADIVINSSRLNPIMDIFKYSKKALSLMRENLLLALVYNIIAIPFAILGYIVPLLAGIAMSSSSLLVILNSLRMNSEKNFK